MRRLVVAALKLYKFGISPMLPPACRFVPSCSEYACEAVARFGVWRGLGLSVRRLLRCHPLGPSGYDPVPGRSEDWSEGPRADPST